MPDDEHSIRRTEVLRVADALRAVIERFVATTAPLGVFDGVADDLEAIAARLAEFPQNHLFLGFPEAANAGGVEGPFDYSPIMGLANPLAPPMHLVMRDDAVTGTVICGSAYEGPPGHVHGGYVAAMFDEVLGYTQSLSGSPGMTARLVVNYRSPTPLHTELRAEGRLVSVEGRKILCRGELYAGDVLCAESEGLFISIDGEKFAKMRDERDAARTAESS
jgi:acyl-coenzyme A thioesterase PaaI-like protein